MKLLKKLNLVVLNWCIEAINLTTQPDKSENKINNGGTIDFAVGGQAVIEGVMMRSPNHISIAVRKPDDSIKVQKRYYRSLTQRFKALNLMLVRGVINLFEMMVIGTKAINYSANETIQEELKEELRKDDTKSEEEKTRMEKIVEIVLFSLSLVLALAFSLFLFKAIPLWLTTYLEGKFAVIEENYVVFNLIDGVIKATIFVTYIWVLSMIPSFRRVFEYHGSEHKSIFAYENKLPLTVENAKKQTRFHPRCGTSFIFIVFIISIFVYTLLPKQDVYWQNLLLRISFLPLVAGISYEVLKLSARYITNPIIRMLSAPGLALQRITTKEPDANQLEVGLRSLDEALMMEHQKLT